MECWKYIGRLPQNCCAWRYSVKNGFKMLMYYRVYSAFYSGRPALRPAGQLRCSKSLPTILSPVFALSRLRSLNFELVYS